MDTGTSIVQGCLRKINAYQPGDQQIAPEFNDALDVINSMLDSWSTQQYAVYGSVENILYYSGVTSAGNAYQYTIGAGGDFDVARPLRITNAFTRITTQGSGYDYPIEIISKDRYVEYGLKSINYPWPTALWYNPTFPLGNIYFYGAPSAGGELHLFTDTILTALTPQGEVLMPQGYKRWLLWGGAREIASEFGAMWGPQMEKLYCEARDVIKSLNAQPIPESKIDSELLGDRTDAGFILYGGYR
jgi:hypothetical protein